MADLYLMQFSQHRSLVFHQLIAPLSFDNVYIVLWWIVLFLFAECEQNVHKRCLESTKDTCKKEKEKDIRKRPPSGIFPKPPPKVPVPPQGLYTLVTYGLCFCCRDLSLCSSLKCSNIWLTFECIKKPDLFVVGIFTSVFTCHLLLVWNWTLTVLAFTV